MGNHERSATYGIFGIIMAVVSFFNRLRRRYYLLILVLDVFPLWSDLLVVRHKY